MSKPSTGNAEPDRRERLARALRENLAKRKALMRARRLRRPERCGNETTSPSTMARDAMTNATMAVDNENNKPEPRGRPGQDNNHG